VLRPGAANLAPDGRAQRLGPPDYEPLVRLFEDGDATGERPQFFQPSSLTAGVYFGVREEGALVAAAGTLVCTPEQSAACIGNVYTRRDRRGCGLARCATAAVTAELLRQRIRTIALNVRSDNFAAVRIYEQLGFTRYCEYQEARAITSAP
jgi:predicted GNAT family acetyltransferase